MSRKRCAQLEMQSVSQAESLVPGLEMHLSQQVSVSLEMICCTAAFWFSSWIKACIAAAAAGSADGSIFFFFFVASGCRLDVYGGWGVGWGGEEGGRGDGGGGLKLGKGGLGFGGGAWERGRAVDKESRPGVGLPVGGDLNDGRWETTVGVRWDLGGSGGPGCPC